MRSKARALERVVLDGTFMKTMLTRIGYRTLVMFATLCVSIFFVWSVGAIGFHTYLPSWLGMSLGGTYFVAMLWLLYRTKPKTRWLSYAAFAIGLIYLLTLIQRPLLDRQWAADHARMPIVRFLGENVQITNVRHCRYRTETDYDVDYEQLSFRHDQLTRVWFIVQRFSSIDGLAHTFLSFEALTDDGPKYFSVSVEIRREADEIFSPIRGLYRQYELIYVVGDERDVIGVRTNIRESDWVHMYNVNTPPAQVQHLFDEIASRLNGLRSKPEFYHTFLNNCTNAIVRHTYKLTPEPINWLDPRIVMPGFSDRYAAAHGLIGEPSQTFDDLQSRSRIDAIARQVGLTDEFSTRIRRSNEPE